MKSGHSKVMTALQAGKPLTYQELMRKTRLGYMGVYVNVRDLQDMGLVQKELAGTKALFSLVPQVEEPHETTVQRAIRKRPALHSIWMN